MLKFNFNENKFFKMFKISSFYFAILIITLPNCISAAEELKPTEEACKVQENCEKCIQTFGCEWCKDLNFTSNRCFYKVSTCNRSSVENPKSMLEQSGLVSNHAINPPKATIKLRPGDKLNITMEYTDEKNRPLDLYILMDLSCTMSTHKDNIAQLTGELVKTLKKTLTKDLKLGFGSFVDKPIGPYVSQSNKENKNITCNGKNIIYKTPHLFKNHLSLTDDVGKFTKIVNQAEISTNIDIPEGGLDALVQAISCTDKLGWRSANNTRKLIVLATDGPFHIAGDGKLGGIIRPNDGQCYLNDEGVYTEATKYDYPTISQVRDKIKDSNIFVIFAVTKSQLPLYKQLVNFIGPTMSSASSIDGSEITSVIRNEFEQLTKTVNFRLLPNSQLPEKHLDVKFYAKCLDKKDFVLREGCDNLTPGANVTFKVEIGLKSCPSNKTLWEKSTVQIAPVDSVGEHNTLNITLDMLCGCDCDKPSDSINALGNDLECSGNGMIKCGICKCNEGFEGPTCNCSSKDGRNSGQDLCRKNNQICGNQGECFCGKCRNCNPGFTGEFCECRTDDCIFIVDEDAGICNSDNKQGTCECGKCICNPPFTGPRCECRNDNNCTDSQSKNNKPCNGFGTCCNECKCDDNHRGPFCRYQKAQQVCDQKAISEMAACVKCLTVDNANINYDKQKVKACLIECEQANVEFTDEISEQINDACVENKVENERKCSISFTIGDKDEITGKIKLLTERGAREENCPTPPAIVPIIIIVVLTITIIGILLLLIWKVVTYIHDKQEYEKFNKERADASWMMNQNPLYKETTTEFQNPAYSKED